MEDRISELPDDVLQKITHLLPLKDAVGTSILSKRWRSMDVSSSFLGLNFMLHEPWKYNKNITKKLRRSLYILDKLLRRRGSSVSIQKFEVMISISNFRWVTTKILFPALELKFSPDELIGIPLQREVNRWMSAVAKPGLSVLDLWISVCHEDYYSIPLSRLAAAKSLKTLSLRGFEICCSSDSDRDRVDVSFPCLEQLSLESSSFDDFVMENLLKGSPLIENLQIIDCHGFETLKVEGVSRLKTLRVKDDHSRLPHKFVIDAPCLRVVDIYGASPGGITLATCPQFLQQFKCQLDDVYMNKCHLDDVYMNYYFLEGAELPIVEWLCRLVDKCGFLEHLTISGLYIRTREKVHISSTLHALKTLNLSDGNLVSFEIVAPNLEKFYMAPTTDLPFICLNASEQLEVELCFYRFYPSRFYPDCEVNNEWWYTRWVEFLSYFNHSRALIIEACQQEPFYYVPKGSRKDLVPPLVGVKSLELRIDVASCTTSCWLRKSSSPMPFSHYVDYMLWLSPRPTKLTLRSSTGREVVIKCSYDDTKVVDVNKDKYCEDCNLLEVNCWRHSLKQVIIEKFEGDEMEKQNIKSFFQEQVNNLDYVEPVSDVNYLENGLYEYYDRLFGYYM